MSIRSPPPPLQGLDPSMITLINISVCRSSRFLRPTLSLFFPSSTCYPTCIPYLYTCQHVLMEKRETASSSILTNVFTRSRGTHTCSLVHGARIRVHSFTGHAYVFTRSRGTHTCSLVHGARIRVHSFTGHAYARKRELT